MTYAVDRLHEEIAYVAYHFHWPQSEILDLGRESRFFTPAQRKAMNLRDQECTTPGCPMPAEFCEAHHQVPWSQGGNTNLDDGRLACNFHHHRLHDPRFSHELLPNGDIRFHRRS